MDFFNNVYPIDIDEARSLAKTNLEINNVITGIKTQFYFTTFDKDSNKFQFCYLNYKNKFFGWFLELKFKQEDFYKHLLLYTVELSREFNLIDSDIIYNSFLYQMRTGLESIPITTISNLEIDNLNVRYKQNAYILSPFGVEIMPFTTRREFYQGLLGSADFVEDHFNKKYTYVLMNGRNGLFKIGRSKNPLNREKTLEGQNPDNLLINYWEADPSFEIELHEMFATQRKRGEWFELGMKDIMRLNKRVREYHDTRIN